MLKKREKKGKGRSEKQEKEYEVNKTSGTIPGYLVLVTIWLAVVFRNTQKRGNTKNVYYSLFLVGVMLLFFPKDKNPFFLSFQLAREVIIDAFAFFFFHAVWILVAAFSADKNEGGRNAGSNRLTFFWYSLYVGYFSTEICSVNAVLPWNNNDNNNAPT